MGTPVHKLTTKPRLLGATIVVSSDPIKIAAKPKLLGATVVVSASPIKIAAKPRLLGATVVTDYSPQFKITPKPRLLGAMVVVDHLGLGSIPTSTQLKPYLLGACMTVEFSLPISWDGTNRMTDSAWRQDDDTRLTDVKQLFGNQRYIQTRFAEDHDPVTGAHKTKKLSAFAGFEQVTARAADPVPTNLGGMKLQLVELTGPTVSSVYLISAPPGPSVEGVFEFVQVFGGDFLWGSYVAVKKIAPRGI